ncbi:uncharacterized protein [Triticum aestivum]|nr:uncharacterized protein LOC123135926 isoform X1 [Triticum aestivum]
MSSFRRPSRSPAAAAPLDDEDLLSEILLRLPPQPSSLPRASLVCKRWCCLVSDPRFLRRFRRHHRRNPPLLGFFFEEVIPARGISFVPTLEPPNRVPVGRFSLQFDDGDRYRLLNCRHGLVLILFGKHNQALVWDPVNGDQHRVAVPPSFYMAAPTRVRGAVLRPAGDIRHFQVVLIGTHKEQHKPGIACVYSSETKEWGNLVSTPLPPENSIYSFRTIVYRGMACVLVGNCLYWLLSERSALILEFDLDMQRLAVIHAPVDIGANSNCHFSVMRAEGGGLGFLFLSDFNAQIWSRKKDCDAAVSWVLRRTVQLDKLLPLKQGMGVVPLILLLLGLAEDNNVLFLMADAGIFMVQLESLQFKRLSKISFWRHLHPFETVYTAETYIGGEHDGADLFAQHIG